MPRSPYMVRRRGSYDGTIADLIRRGGEIQAQREYASGDAWGRGIAQAGQILGQGIQQFTGIRAEEKAYKEDVAAQAKRNGRFAAVVQNSDKMSPQEFVAHTVDIYDDKGIEVAEGFFSMQRLGYEIEAARQAVEAGDREAAAAADAQVRADLGRVANGIEVLGGPDDPNARWALDQIVPLAADYYGNPEMTTDWVAENWDAVKSDLMPEEEAKPDSRGFEARIADAAEAGDIEGFETLISAREQFAEAGREPVDALDRRLKELQVQREQLAVDAAKAPKTEDGEEPVKLGAAALDRVAGADQGIKLAQNLDKLVQERWLGPVLGRATEAGVGLPGVPVSEELAEFYADTATLKNATVKAITGAQMSEPEAERIMKQIPTFADKPVVWRKKLEQTIANLRLMRERIVTLASGDVSDPSTGDPLGILGGGAGDPLGLNQ